MMQYVLIGIAAVISAVAMLAALKLLLSPKWIIQWLRGSFGLFLVLFSLSLGLVGYTFSQFNYAPEPKVIATLSFDQLQAQEFEVELVTSTGMKKVFRLHGDQWQLDARMLSGVGFGDLPLYRLERLTGRYLSLEQERQTEKSVYGLLETESLDVWNFLYKNKWLGFLSAQYGSAAYMPMADGAIFEVSLTQNGLVGEALNETAKSLVQDWE